MKGYIFAIVVALAAVLFSRTDYFSSKPQSYKQYWDFSGIHRKIPSKVVEVFDPSTVQAAFSSYSNEDITVRGAGHSLGGLTTTNGVLLLNKNKKIMRLKSDDLVEVSSGYSVGEVEEFLRRKSRHLPCLQDHHVFSVGGTIAVGGIGWESIKCGTFSHWVQEINLILPNGTRITASREQNKDIFQFTLGGLGQTGYIDTAVIKTLPWKSVWKYGVFSFDTIKEAFDFLNENMDKLKGDQVDVFHGGRLRKEKDIHFNIGRRFYTEEERNAWNFTNFFTVDPTRYTEGKDAVEIPFSIQNMFPYQLWTDYSFTDVQTAEKFTAAIFGEEHMHTKIPDLFADKPEYLFLAFYVLKPQGWDYPLSLIHPNRTDFVFSVGTYYSGTEESQTTKMKNLLLRNLDLCVKHGGRPYNYGYVPLSEEQAKQTYKNHFDTFVSMKQQLKEKHQWIKSNFTALAA
ncbi:FAD-binding oxidoreductase [Brasilonema sp. CT11]|nr:FAD-binding oxidoreductase [Brasilonema sp. CT11]